MSDLYPSRVSERPSIVERKDPVVFGSPTDGPLTAEQLALYKERGYLFFESFLPDTELSEAKEECSSIFRTSESSDDGAVIREPGSHEVRSVFEVHRSSSIFEKLTLNDRLQEIVRQLLGSDVYVHQSRINFKPGFTGKEFYWHSDFETWHVEDGMPRMRALSCSIALEDNHALNGPLMLVPGSHQHFVACVGTTPDNHYKESLRKQEYGVPDRDSLRWLVESNGIAAPTGPAGSMVLFDCNIMHGSNSNITPMPRSNLFIVFNSVDNVLQAPFSGKNPRPSFIAHRDE